MLKIRLQRVGRKNDPSFRVVVTEHTTAAKKPGSFQEVLGSYDPRKDTNELKVERIKFWMERGAQASGTVHNLLIKAGVITGKKINVLPKKTVPAKEEVKEEVKKEEPKVEDTPAEEVAEEKAEEKVAEPVVEEKPAVEAVSE